MESLNQLLGNAEACSVENATESVKGILSPNEAIEHTYQLYRDALVFTDKRLIIVDYLGINGRRTDYRSIPYTSIVSFAIKTADELALNSELTLFILGGGTDTFVNDKPHESLYGENNPYNTAKKVGLNLLGTVGDLLQSDQREEPYRKEGRYEILAFPKDNKDIHLIQQTLARYILFADCD